MSVRIGWVEIGDGVFVRRYPFLDQNIGVVIGSEGVLVIDSRATDDQAREIIEDLRVVTPRRPTIVVNTHAHWDHCFGNRAFRPCSIWGHADAAAFLARTLEEGRRRAIESDPALSDAVAAVVPDPPDRTLTDAAELDLGDRRVEVRHFGRGHTDHDVVVHVAGTDVVFGGDLIEGGAPPFVDDGYPMDWPATLDGLLTLGVTNHVPGHGGVMDREAVVAQADELRQIVDLAERVFESHLEFEQAVVLAPWPADVAREPIARGVGQLRGDIT